LRSALLVLAPTGFWAAYHLYMASKTIIADQKRAIGYTKSWLLEAMGKTPSIAAGCPLNALRAFEGVAKHSSFTCRGQCAADFAKCLVRAM